MSHKASKLKGLAWIGGALAFAAMLSFAIHPAARSIPWSIEERISRSLGALPDAVPCHGADPLSRQSLAKLVQRLYPLSREDTAFPLTLEPIAGNTVNAFASLGGHVYVYGGLIAESESPEELAGVLAHEIEHVKQRHILQGIMVRLATSQLISLFLSSPGQVDPRIGTMLLEMRFGRDQEQEADEGGLRRLQEARIDSAGFQRFFERAESSALVPTLLSDHPSNPSRAELARSLRTSDPKPVLTPQEWRALKSICR